MNTFFKKWRKENLNNVGKYLIYAAGEILLIIIGILIAVTINEKQTIKKNNVLRCQYLDELKFAFDYDIKDVEENIEAFNRRNPKIKDLLDGVKNKNLTEVDSLGDKINTLNRYVFFVQQSKSKIEELKYSNVNLITDRSLKNRILLYQESKVKFLLDQERRYDRITEDVRRYFSNKFLEVDAEKLETDKHFYTIAVQKYDSNEGMKENYVHLLKELNEIKKLIEEKISEDCSEY